MFIFPNGTFSNGLIYPLLHDFANASSIDSAILKLYKTKGFFLLNNSNISYSF